MIFFSGFSPPLHLLSSLLLLEKKLVEPMSNYPLSSFTSSHLLPSLLLVFSVSEEKVLLFSPPSSSSYSSKLPHLLRHCSSPPSFSPFSPHPTSFTSSLLSSVLLYLLLHLLPCLTSPPILSSPHVCFSCHLHHLLCSFISSLSLLHAETNPHQTPLEFSLFLVLKVW